MRTNIYWGGKLGQFIDWADSVNREPAFTRNIGIDYSGAEVPIASLKGLRVYLAEGNAPPVEVPPPPSPRKYWTRKGIAA